MSLPPAILLIGATASGKSTLGLAIQARFPVEIISMDSALVYRGMNIGTAKPSADVLQKVPHHLIDILEPTQSYSVAHFRDDALRIMADIHARQRIPMLVGGTMLYAKSLLYGLDKLPSAQPTIRAQINSEAQQQGWPAMHHKLAQLDPITAARLSIHDAQRIQRALEVHAITGNPLSSLFKLQKAPPFPYRVLKLGLLFSDRTALHTRIATRFANMLQEGLVDEVRQLLQTYPSLDARSTSMRCVGYRQVLQYLSGDYAQDTLLDRGIFATRQLAKRQLSSLRAMPDMTVIDCLQTDWQDVAFSAVQEFTLARH
ncbi:MAG: tRNA (adenosine(37)-N6)-dimethylallyltransferase MiaA [Methylophilaceae bacterium]|nr:tRNA (adenosine(37)-N6)-dimethylallyltransferase MiaA [Methylophilaceae bacterium]